MATDNRTRFAGFGQDSMTKLVLQTCNMGNQFTEFYQRIRELPIEHARQVSEDASGEATQAEFQLELLTHLLEENAETIDCGDLLTMASLMKELTRKVATLREIRDIADGAVRARGDGVH